MKPIEPKAPGVENVLEKLGEMAFGRSRKNSMRDGTCVSCGEQITGFKDEISSREYEITGFCQSCQDKFFSPEDE